MVVSVPVHIWAWVIFLHDLPGYFLRLSIWQILALLSYVLIYSLFESIVATLVLILLVWLIPFRIRENGYSLQGSVLLLVAVLVAAFVHLQRELVTSLGLDVSHYLVLVGFVGFACLAILVGLSFAPRRQPGIAERILVFLDRLSILAVIYLVLDGFALCLIVVRLLIAVIF